MFKIFLCFKILLLVADIVLCKPDYIYNEQAGGWLKLHMIPATWEDAFLKCHYEGAVLASPLDENLAKALHMVVAMSLQTRIYLGTYSLFNDKNYVSIEGVPLENMSIQWDRNREVGNNGDCLAMTYEGDAESMYQMTSLSCSETLPYICYKKRDDGQKFNECGTFDNKYHLDRKTGSCYKLHNEAKPWSKAYEICTDEGGYLVIINDDVEARVINGMFPNQTVSRFTGPTELMHVGVRRWSRDGTWLTIHGEPMEDVYNNWLTDRFHENPRGNNKCASITKEGTLTEKDYDFSAKFVCEKDPKISRYDNVRNNVTKDIPTRQPLSLFHRKRG